jgi:hypothetical protein
MIQYVVGYIKEAIIGEWFPHRADRTTLICSPFKVPQVQSEALSKYQIIHSLDSIIRHDCHFYFWRYKYNWQWREVYYDMHNIEIDHRTRSYSISKTLKVQKIEHSAQSSIHGNLTIDKLGTSALSRIISLFANDIFNIESLFQFFSNVV